MTARKMFESLGYEYCKYYDRNKIIQYYNEEETEFVFWIEEQEFSASEYGEPKNVGTMQRDRVCLMEIWVEVFNGARGNFPNTEQREINAILDHLGWERTKGPVWIDQKVYLKQRARLRPHRGKKG